MKPPVFSYSRPATLDESLAMLRHGAESEVTVLAGGQSLMPVLNFRLARPALLMDINGLKQLDFVERENGAVRIGALTRHRALLTNDLIKQLVPLMADAAAYIGYPAIRNRGTIGGSISHADPAAELPVVLTALDAQIVLQSTKGKRALRTGEFFTGPLVTARESDELLIEVIVPSQQPGSGWGFHEVARRHGDFALVAAAATLSVDSERRVRTVTLALGGIADRPIRLHACEEMLVGHEPLADRLRKAILDTATGVEVNSDIHASADYRRHLARVLAFRALLDASKRAVSASPHGGGQVDGSRDWK